MRNVLRVENDDPSAMVLPLILGEGQELTLKLVPGNEVEVWACGFLMMRHPADIPLRLCAQSQRFHG